MTASAEILDELRRSSLPIEARACLAALAETEADSFRSLYDGTLWTGSMASFPDWPGKTGPTGQPTHAAGAWQDQPATYRDISAITGDTSFEPASQVKNNWALAQHDFKARSGGDLLTALIDGSIGDVQQNLHATWVGGADSGFAARYADNLAALDAASPPSPPPISAQADVIVDLYHGDGPIDFTAMKAAGIEAVILKCTEGATFVDPTFAARTVAAAAAGMLVGAYHFFSTRSSGAAQVDWFLQHAGTTSMLVMDFEPDPTSLELQATQARMVDEIHTRTGRWPLLYTGRWLITAAEPRLSQCPLWLANWNPDPDPPLPPGFTEWKLWQYTRTGSVPGVAGPCDRSRFAGTVAELHDWWHGGTPGSGELTTLVKKLAMLVDMQAVQLAAATQSVAGAVDSGTKIEANLKLIAAALPAASLIQGEKS